jgi:hypothetical protein
MTRKIWKSWFNMVHYVEMVTYSVRPRTQREPSRVPAQSPESRGTPGRVPAQSPESQGTPGTKVMPSGANARDPDLIQSRGDTRGKPNFVVRPGVCRVFFLGARQKTHFAVCFFTRDKCSLPCVVFFLRTANNLCCASFSFSALWGGYPKNSDDSPNTRERS